MVYVPYTTYIFYILFMWKYIHNKHISKYLYIIFMHLKKCYIISAKYLNCQICDTHTKISFTFKNTFLKTIITYQNKYDNGSIHSLLDDTIVWPSKTFTICFSSLFSRSHTNTQWKKMRYRSDMRPHKCISLRPRRCLSKTD